VLRPLCRALRRICSTAREGYLHHSSASYLPGPIPSLPHNAHLVRPNVRCRLWYCHPTLHDASALEAGVRLLPYVALMVFACIVNGAVLSMYGLYMPWYVVGGVLFTIGSALMYTVGVSTSVSAVYGYSVLLGVGVGIFVQASFAVAQGIVKEDEIPSAVGFITCGQITGITISISVANSIFLNKAETGISELLPQVPITDIQAAIAGVGSKFVQSLPEDVKEAVLEVIVTSLSKTYIMNIVAGALSVILAVFMKRERLFLAVAGAA